MTEVIASAVVELARFALYAYAVKQGRDVIVHWLDAGQPGLKSTAETRILDLARGAGVDLRALAQKVSES